MKNDTKLPTFPIGALEVILECQELLAGRREQLTSIDEYIDQRRNYWRMQAMRPRHRDQAAQRSQAA
jgi:hypothetical protein